MNLVIDAIKSRLEKISDTLVLQMPPDDDRSSAVILKKPTIFKGYLPPKSAPDKNKPPEFPHIIIRPSEGGMTDEMDVMRVKFLLGGFCEEATGYEWLLNAYNRMALDFQSYPIFEGICAFQCDFKWKVFDDQPFPFWVMEAIGTWSLIKPQNIQSMDDH